MVAVVRSPTLIAESLRQVITYSNTLRSLAFVVSVTLVELISLAKCEFGLITAGSLFDWWARAPLPFYLLIEFRRRIGILSRKYYYNLVLTC